MRRTRARDPGSRSDCPGQVGNGRMSDRASCAVTVLTGATPVVTGIVEPIREGVLQSLRVRRWRPRVLAGMGAALTLAVGGILAMTAGGPATRPARPAQGTTAAVAAPPRSRERPAGRVGHGQRQRRGRTAIRRPSLSSRFHRPGKRSRSPPRTRRRLPPRLHRHLVPPPRDPSGCVPPFTIDPATGKKKWKLECL